MGIREIMIQNEKEIAAKLIELKELQEKEFKIQTLVGMDLDTLIDLFAKGYTLKQPN